MAHRFIASQIASFVMEMKARACSRVGLDDVPLLVLAGGLGTRLRSVWKDKPKILVPVNGRPYFDWFVESMRESGFRRIVFLLGVGYEHIVEHIESMHAPEGLSWVIENQPLGTGGALKWALKGIRDERFFLMNGDSYCKTDYVEMFHDHCSSGGVATMALAQVADSRDFGLVSLGGGSRVTSFKEKQELGRAGCVNAGIYVLESRCANYFSSSERFSLERDVFPLLCTEGLLHGYRSKGTLLDIGTPERLKLAQVELCSLMK